MIKYKATFYSVPKISKVEIVKETEKQIVFANNRENKVTEFYFYGNTYKEAKEWILNKILKDKSILEKEILRKQEQIKVKDISFAEVFNWEEE